MYDPANEQDWVAVAWCEVCEEDTDHYFNTQGRYHPTYATCEVCGREESIDPDSGD